MARQDCLGRRVSRTVCRLCLSQLQSLPKVLVPVLAVESPELSVTCVCLSCGVYQSCRVTECMDNTEDVISAEDMDIVNSVWVIFMTDRNSAVWISPQSSWGDMPLAVTLTVLQVRVRHPVIREWCWGPSTNKAFLLTSWTDWPLK